jgi:hypothetical protein
LEQQLRSSVLAEPGTAARARVPGEHES